MIEWLKEKGCGEAKVQYKLRDWIFSRQRYWGEPIPIIHMEDGTMRTVDTSDLPLGLPATDNYKPHFDGESPLANCEDWLNVEIDGVKGKRETNTMPQWAGSCWYYMRYLDPHNDEALADKALLDHWLPVDLYVGGTEHAVLHLLYSRFWHKVLYDAGVVSSKEPFQKLFHQGIILGEDGSKMSKSRGNVVNPDELIQSHGADALRLYEMFMGPLEASLPWSSDGVTGSKKWLDRVYRMAMDENMVTEDAVPELDYSYNFMVKKVTNDIETLDFNTGISQMMIFVNDCYKQGKINKDMLIGLIKILSCFAPHMGEELYSRITGEESLKNAVWPTYNEDALKLDTVEIAVQISGKIKLKLDVPGGMDQKGLEDYCLSLPEVQELIEGKDVVKIIAVPGRLLNIVVK